MKYFFGCVMFDDPKAPGPGWASIEGEQAARVQTLGELATDTIWLCNAKYEEFYRTTDLSLNPWLRHDGYLPLKIQDILNEWGSDPDQLTNIDVASFVSEVFSKIMRISMRLLQKNNPKLGDEEIFLNRALKDDLRPLLPEAEFPRDEAGTILRSGVGYLEFTKVVNRPGRGQKLMVLKRPRLDHAIDMLTTPIPLGPFQFTQGDNLPTARELSLSEKPVFANIVLRRTPDPAISQIYAFGSSMGGRRVPRTWVPQPELAVLNAISTVEVQNAFIGKRYTDMATGLAEFVRTFLESGDSSISWSCGVVTEALWRAAALGMERKDSNLPYAEQPQTSWRGAWVNAADKISTFFLAVRLNRAGFSVNAYGFGTLYCFVAPERRQDLIIEAWKCGLLPSIREIETPLDNEQLRTLKWGGEQRSQIFAQCLFKKNQDLLWDLDRIPLSTKEERHKILVEARSQL